MKKLILLSIIAFISAFAYVNAESLGLKNEPEVQIIQENNDGDSDQDLKVVEDNGYTIFTDIDHTVTFVLLEPERFQLDLLYDPQVNQDIEAVSQDNNYDFAVNGSYFLENLTHAGLLYLDGEIVTNLAPLDKQLSHVVMMNRDGDLDFLPSANFDASNLNSDFTAFQTGPLVLLNDVVQDNYIDNSLNGKTAHRRSFLGYTDTGKIFFGVFAKQVTLREMADELLNMQMWAGAKLTVVNLDGGSSVAFYSANNDSVNYGVFKALPIVIGARER